MGYHTEINSMLRLGKDDSKPEDLRVGELYTIKKSNIRIYLHDMAMLLLSENWVVLGYCAIRKTTTSAGTMELIFEVLSLFTPEESKMYTTKYREAAKITKEL